jgi:hypothetical protein
MIGGDRSEGVRKFRLGHSLARVFSHFWWSHPQKWWPNWLFWLHASSLPPCTQGHTGFSIHHLIYMAHIQAPILAVLMLCPLPGLSSQLSSL